MKRSFVMFLVAAAALLGCEVALRAFAGPFGGWTAAEIVIFGLLLAVVGVGRSIKRYAAVLTAVSMVVLGLVTYPWPFLCDAFLLLALAAVCVEVVYVLLFPEPSRLHTSSVPSILIKAVHSVRALLRRIA